MPVSINVVLDLVRLQLNDVSQHAISLMARHPSMASRADLHRQGLCA